MGYSENRRKELLAAGSVSSYSQRRKQELTTENAASTSNQQQLNRYSFDQAQKQVDQKNISGIAPVSKVKSYGDYSVDYLMSKLSPSARASAEQDAEQAYQNVKNRPWYVPKPVAIVSEDLKLSKEARLLFAKKNQDAQANSAGGVAVNSYLDSITVGLLPTLQKIQAKKLGASGQEFLKQQEEAKAKHPVANVLGTAAGYIAPGAVAEKGATKLLAPALEKVGSNLAKKAITGAATAGGMELTEGVVRGESPKQIAKRTAIGTGVGALGDVALYGAGKGIGKALSKLSTEKALPAVESNLTKTTLDKVPAKTATTTLDKLPEPSNKVVLESPKTKTNAKQSMSNLYTKIVDKNNPIANFSKAANDRTGILASNASNANGTADYIINDALVDRQGNKIGDSLKQVADEIPKGQEKDFWEYMCQRHNIDRAREGKNVIANYTPEMSQQAVKQAEALHPEWKSTGDKITNWIDKFMREWGVDSGTVDSEIYGKLRDTYKSYFPTQREFSELEKSIPGDVREQFVDSSTPIKSATGSARDIHDPVSNIISLVNRTVKTARYNEVGQSLLNSVRSQPDKLRPLAEIVEKPKNVDNVVTVLENGKPVYLQINDKALLDSLKNMPKVVNNAQVMRKITNVYKSLITQKNPIFAVRNMARDIPTAYVYGSESNPVKFIGGLLKAGKDIVTNSENLQRYKALGGGGANFLAGNADNASKNLLKNPNLLQKAGGAIEKFNNITETAPRLAEFNRVYEKTGDVQKAIAAANDVTVNFSRGGNVTKSLDPFVPYLNASVQGLDKFFRQVKNKPLETLVKSGVAITAPEVALYLVNKDDPNYKELDNRTKDNYFLIPKGDGTFVKIPKSRELGSLFGSLFQRIARASEGDNGAFKGYGNTLATTFAPTNPIENNILSPLVYNLPSNKDFAGRSIVPLGMQMDKRSKYLQYDEKTSEIAKKIGKLSAEATGGQGLSPKQIDYVIKSYTGVIGQLGIPATTNNGTPLKSITSQFTADPVYSNQTVQDFYNNYETVQRKATDKNILGNIPSKELTQEEKVKGVFRKASQQISALNKQINAAGKDKAKIKELRKQIIDIASAANNSIK